MAYEAYRVLKRFQWRGWEYAPSGQCECSSQLNPDGNACMENDCTCQVGTGCEACPPEACRCACNIPAETYGGEVWIVEDGHPRKEYMLSARFATYDDRLPSITELMKDKDISRLVKFPKGKPVRKEKIKHEPLKPGDVRVPQEV